MKRLSIILGILTLFVSTGFSQIDANDHVTIAHGDQNIIWHTQLSGNPYNATFTYAQQISFLGVANGTAVVMSATDAERYEVLKARYNEHEELFDRTQLQIEGFKKLKSQANLTDEHCQP